jgi:hypothetical protein
MIADNCLPNPKVENTSNVTVKFVQPKASLDLQPSNQGSRKRKCKVLYRKLLLISVIVNTNNFQFITKFLKSINVVSAVLWFAEDWDKVNPDLSH